MWVEAIDRRRPNEGFGGARRDRTDDLLLAKQALSQLSYGPARTGRAHRIMVGPGRVELPTSRLSGVRSNHLSYGPPFRKDAGFPNAKRPAEPIAGRSRERNASAKKEKRRRRRPAILAMTGHVSKRSDSRAGLRRTPCS